MPPLPSAFLPLAIIAAQCFAGLLAAIAFLVFGRRMDALQALLCALTLPGGALPAATLRLVNAFRGTSPAGSLGFLALSMAQPFISFALLALVAVLLMKLQTPLRLAPLLAGLLAALLAQGWVAWRIRTNYRGRETG